MSQRKPATKLYHAQKAYDLLILVNGIEDRDRRGALIYGYMKPFNNEDHRKIIQAATDMSLNKLIKRCMEDYTPARKHIHAGYNRKLNDRVM